MSKIKKKKDQNKKIKKLEKLEKGKSNKLPYYTIEQKFGKRKISTVILHKVSIHANSKTQKIK